MKSDNRKTLLFSLGNMILMSLLLQAVINYLFRYIDELTKYTFLFDGLIILSSILFGGLLSFVVKKNVKEDVCVYASSSAILLVLTLILSYALIPTMSIFVPQFMTTCFLIPGIVFQLALLLWPVIFKKTQPQLQ